MFSTVPCEKTTETVPSPQTLDGALLQAVTGAGRPTSWETRLTDAEKLEVCARIKSARQQAGLTQEELAKILHVRQRTIANYESTRVPFRLLDRIAEATGVSTEWLLRGDAAKRATDASVERLHADLALVQQQVSEILELLRRQAGT